MKKSLIPILLVVIALVGCGKPKSGEDKPADSLAPVPGTPTTSIQPPSVVGGAIKLFTPTGQPQHGATITAAFPANAANQTVTVQDQAATLIATLSAASPSCTVTLVPWSPNYISITPAGATYANFNATPPTPSGTGNMVVTQTDATGANSVTITVQEIIPPKQ